MTHDYQEIDKRFDAAFPESWDERGAAVIFGTAEEFKTFLHSEIARALKERDKEVREKVESIIENEGEETKNTQIGANWAFLKVLAFLAPAESPEVKD